MFLELHLQIEAEGVVGVSFLRLLPAEVELEVEGAVELEGGAQPCGPGVGGELEARRCGEDEEPMASLGERSSASSSSAEDTSPVVENWS